MTKGGLTEHDGGRIEDSFAAIDGFAYWRTAPQCLRNCVYRREQRRREGCLLRSRSVRSDCQCRQRDANLRIERATTAQMTTASNSGQADFASDPSAPFAGPHLCERQLVIREASCQRFARSRPGRVTTTMLQISNLVTAHQLDDAVPKPQRRIYECDDAERMASRIATQPVENDACGALSAPP